MRLFRRILLVACLMATFCYQVSAQQPATLSATPNFNTIALSWNYASFGPSKVIKGWTLFRKTAGGAYSTIASNSATPYTNSYIDYTVGYGGTYYTYMLGVMVGAAPGYWGYDITLFSNEVSATPTSTPPVITITSPSANSYVSTLYNNIAGTVYEQNGLQYCQVSIRRLSDDRIWKYLSFNTPPYPGDWIPGYNEYLPITVTQTGPYTYSFTCSGGPQGSDLGEDTFKIEVFALDGQNIPGYKSIIVTTESTPIIFH